MQVAVLGLGAMGSRMAVALLRAGHNVIGWNRSSRAAPEADGRRVSLASTPREAVAGADVAISMLRDDEASRMVWFESENAALEGLTSDTIAIESSTVSVAWARQWAERCHARGFSCLDAPVVGSRPQADAGQLVVLAGGDGATVARSEPLLRAFAAAGAAVKLAVNALFGIQVVAVAELIALLQACGVDALRAIEIACATPVVSPAAKAAAGAMLAGQFAPLFPVDLAAKDLGYATQIGVTAPVVESAHAVFRRAAAQGLGGENLTAVAKLYSN